MGKNGLANARTPQSYHPSSPLHRPPLPATQITTHSCSWVLLRGRQHSLTGFRSFGLLMIGRWAADGEN